MILAGVDLAWQSESNPTAIAIGSLTDSGLSIVEIHPAVYGLDAICEILLSTQDLKGVAVDAPLIINNETGQRHCENKIGKCYGSRKASCHTSNLKLFPTSRSVALSKFLEENGFYHLDKKKWQIECYPHPAIIEIFGLPERLRYKKGRVKEKKVGQILLASYIKSLDQSSVLKLSLTDDCNFVDEIHIEQLRGKGLKNNEDALDAIICLYIAALYQLGEKGNTYGDVLNGYIWVPNQDCTKIG